MRKSRNFLEKYNNYEKNFYKREKGITLIALIVTIIVLLILAGVTIAALKGNNGILTQTTDAKIMTNLSNVDEAIKLYKSNKKIEKVTNEENEEIVTDEDLIEDKVLNEYVVEETLRPIAIVTSDKLGISNSFGGGYKEISSYSIQDIKAQCIATLKELNNVCAIDLTDGNLYYLKDGQVWSISGNKDIMKTYERVNADINEWTFDTNTKTLTAYNYKDKLKEQRGEQEPGKVIIPNYYNGVRVSGIGSTFANNTDITTLTISNGIHIIKALAFQECKNLKGNIVIPKTVTTIGERAFLNCSSLEGLTIEEGCAASLPDGWCSLGVFQGCKALRGTITIPSTFGNLGTNAFGGCSGIEKIEIKSNKITSIGANAFSGCTSLSGDLIIPDSVINIGANAFNGCNSLNGILKLPNSLQSIGTLAFQECKNLKGNIVIPKTVTTIGERAFLNCSSLEGLTIEEGCTASLPDGWCSLGVFQGCKALRGTITIPSTFGNLGTNAFGGCSGIEKIIIKNSELNIYDGQGTIDPKTIIIGYSNSTAQVYATKYNRIFELIQ